MAGFAESAPQIGFSTLSQPSHGFAALMKSAKSPGSYAQQVGFGADLKRYEEKNAKRVKAKKAAENKARHKRHQRPLEEQRQQVSADRTPPRKAAQARSRRQHVRQRPRHQTRHAA